MINHTTNPTVSDVILRQLKEWGIQHIYGVAGDANLHLLGAIERQKDIQYIGVRHESAAGLMASTEGKCTNRIGVCLCTSGPGLVNLLNGIADASADHIPLLVISGQVESKKVGTEAKQYIDQQLMIAPLAVYSATLIHPDATVDLLKKALIEAVSKKGVAHLAIPKDLFSMPCTQAIQSPLGLLNRALIEDLTQLEQAIYTLLHAEKPMILLGEGARTSADIAVQLAEVLGAGIIETLGAKGCVEATHPLYLFGLGEGGTLESRDAFMQADVIVLVGANWWPDGFVPTQSKIIQIDTSPSSIEGHHNVSYGLVGDAQKVLSMLLTKIQEHQSSAFQNREKWRAQISHYKQKIIQFMDQERQINTSPIAPQRLMAALDTSVADDAIMVVDTGDHTLWFNRIFRAKQQQVLYSGKWRTMGYALPAALAAKLSYPEKQVVAIIGDGSFMMTLMELATAIKYNLPIIVVIMNNQSLAMEKHKMMVEQIQPFGTGLYNPNFAQLAQAFGATGIMVQKAEELQAALQTAFNAKQTVVLDVHVAQGIPPLTGFKKRLKRVEK